MKKFKPEIIKEVNEWLKAARNGLICPGGVNVLEALADHDALSDNAYEKEPRVIYHCSACNFATIEVGGTHQSLHCPGKPVKMIEAKE